MRLGAATIAAAALAACAPARAPARVGFLANAPFDDPPVRDMLRRELAALGWVEGNNLNLTWQYTTGAEPWLTDVAAEFIRSLDVDNNTFS